MALATAGVVSGIAGCLSADFGQAGALCSNGDRGCACSSAMPCADGLECVAGICGTFEDATLESDQDDGSADGTMSGEETSDGGDTSATSSGETTQTSATATPTSSDTTGDEESSEVESSSEESETSQASCANGIKDGDESDVDCGGSCPGCDNGKECESDGDCLSAHCENGLCADEQVAECQTNADCGPSPMPCFEMQCTDQHMCEVVALVDASPCDDGDACTIGDRCDAGTCRGSDGRVFIETFAQSEDRDWIVELGHPKQPNPFFAVAPAKASVCDQKGDPANTGEDPGTDASPDDVDPNNRLLGSLIGRCVGPLLPAGWECSFTPRLMLPSDQELSISYMQQRHFDGFDDAAGQGWRTMLRYLAEDDTAVFADLRSASAFNDAAWVEAEAGLQDVPRGVPLRLGFCLASQGSATSSIPTPTLIAGWSIDDIVVGPPGCRELHATLP
jgi:hypothetical protein